MKKVLAFVLLLFVLAACGSKNESRPEGLVETTVGKEFKVVLESNPTTGYHWEVVGDLDKNIVELVSRDYRSDQPVMPGSGGSDVWVFKGVGVGETTITLGYYPPDASAEPQQTRTFTVKVK